MPALFRRHPCRRSLNHDGFEGLREAGMVEGSRPGNEPVPQMGAVPHRPETDAVAAPRQRVVAVRKALDETVELYKAGKYGAAAHICAQIVAARPRMAAA